MAGHQRTADTPVGGGRADTPAGGGQAGAITYYGWVYMLTLWGKEGYGGYPNAEAGKMHQHQVLCSAVISGAGYGYRPVPSTVPSYCRITYYVLYIHYTTHNINQ
jgi:hypothetical protein